MRSVDWSATPLGSLETWSASLTHALEICLASPLPTYLWWGDALTFFYNDAAIGYLPLARHPAVLGRPGREAWLDLWDTLGPAIKNVFNTRTGAHCRDIPLFLDRGLPREEAHLTFSLCPVYADAAHVGGVLGTGLETTVAFVCNRRLDTLRRLGTKSDGRASRVAEEAISVLATNPHDVPLAAIYLRRGGRREAHFVAGTGLEPGASFPPAIFDPGEEISTVSALGAVFHGNAVTEIPDFDVFVADSARSPSGARVRRGLALPLRLGRSGEAIGALVVGISPHQPFDQNYRTFFEVVSHHIGVALGGAGMGESRRHQEALASLERTKTELVHRVSDEFRTPLALMLGVLDEEMRESPASRERLEPAHRNALRLLRLINALLDFSGTDTKQIETGFQPTDLAALTTQLAQVFAPVVEKGGVRLVIDCPPFSEPVFVDRTLWEKIVLNLLSNAFKFTFEGEIRVTLRARSENAQLVVTDTGVGIPAEQLPRVFDRFYRAARGRARTYEGAGIGLALVRELTRLHRGAVTVDSVEGHGAAFTVTIPLGSSHLPKDRLREATALPVVTLAAEAYVLEALRWLPESGALTTASDTPWGEAGSVDRVAKTRILLVDAHPDMRDYVSRLLGARCRVETASDGDEALAAIRSQPPELVLIDVMLPRIDGFGLLRALRDHPRTRTLPVILISARTGDEARLAALEAGADDYVLKPFSTRELLARIDATLALARTRGEAHEREQELHARIVDILESMTDGFMAVDRAWRVTYVNAAAEKINHRSRDALLGRSLWDLFGDRWGVAMESAYRRAMTRRVPEKVEIFDETSARWFEQEAYPIHAGGLAFYIRDLTARKQAERALVDSEAKFRTLADATSAIIWFVDENLQSRYVNRRCLEYFGRTEEGILGSAWHDCLHPDDAAGFFAQLQGAVRDRRPLRTRCRMRRHDGEWRMLEAQALPHFSEDRHYLGHVGHSLDITETLAASLALRESEERLRIATEAAQIYTWDVDAGSGEVRRSANAPHLLGFDRFASEAGLLDSVHPADRELVSAAFARCAREGGRMKLDYRLQPPGRTDAVWVRAEGILLEDGPAGSRRIIGIAQNITDAKRAELNAVFLAEINGEFARLTRSDEIMRVVGDRALRHFGVARLTFAEIDQAADCVTPVYDSHEPGAEGSREPHRIRDFVTERLLTEVAADRVVAVNDIETDPRTAEFAAAYRPFQIRAMLTAPFFSEGRWTFALCAQRREPYVWRTDEIDLMRELAARVYPRLQRARAEEALQASQERMRENDERHRTWLNSIEEGFGIVEVRFDEAGHPRDFRLVEVNPAFVRQAGRKDIVDRWMQTLVAESAEDWPEIFARVVRTGAPMRFQSCALAQDRWHEMYVFPLGQREPGRVAILCKDLTEIRRRQEDLESRVRESTAARDAVNDALRDEIAERQRAEVARQDLLRQLVNAQEDERRRISRELHDDIGQHLAALLLGLKSLETAQDSDEKREAVRALEAIAERVGRETHELALELRPTALDDLGLVRTLANYTEQWSARFGIEVEYHSSAWTGPRLPSHMETALYRIVQEALTNVLRHARARHVSLIVERRRDLAIVIVEDDGAGFDAEAARGSIESQRLGLRGMRERASLLDGELKVESTPGKGTTIFVRIPCPDA